MPSDILCTRRSTVTGCGTGTKSKGGKEGRSDAGQVVGSAAGASRGHDAWCAKRTAGHKVARHSAWHSLDKQSKTTQLSYGGRAEARGRSVQLESAAAGSFGTRMSRLWRHARATASGTAGAKSCKRTKRHDRRQLCGAPVSGAAVSGGRAAGSNAKVAFDIARTVGTPPGGHAQAQETKYGEV